jgi:hypothetical protein
MARCSRQSPQTIDDARDQSHLSIDSSVHSATLASCRNIQIVTLGSNFTTRELRWARWRIGCARPVSWESVRDLDKRGRYIRIASVALATALISEGMWAHKIQRDRERCREEREVRLHGGR